MWSNTYSPNKTNLCFNDAFEQSYGQAKQMDQESRTSTVHATGHRHHLQRNDSIHDNLSSPMSTESTSSTATSRLNMSSLPQQIVSVNKIFNYSKAVANDMKMKFSMSKLVKSAPTEEMTKNAEHLPYYNIYNQPIGQRNQHRPLYYRASSPVFNNRKYDSKQMHEIYANTARYHHSAPLTMASEYDKEFLLPASTCKPHNVQHRAFAYTGCMQPTERTSTPTHHESVCRARVTYPSYGTDTTCQLSQECDRPTTNQNEVQTVMMDKLSSPVDTEHRNTGGIILCGGTEVGKFVILCAYCALSIAYSYNVLLKEQTKVSIVDLLT